MVRDYVGLVLIAGAVLVLDQVSKLVVRTRLELGEVWVPLPETVPFVRIVHWSNTGAAFGLFPAAGLFFTVVAVIVAAAILYYYPRIPAGQASLRFALALQLGGAMGNLTDRLTLGPVTDFIAVSQIPVFNLADASISLGVAVLVLAMWREERSGSLEGQDEDTRSVIEAAELKAEADRDRG